MAVLTDISPEITIEGLDLDDYTVMEVQLSKELLKPASLRFSMRKKQLLRNQDDISFSLANQLLGARVELAISAIRHDETMNLCEEMLSFSGIIFGAQTRRERIGQANYIFITAYSPDYLLVDNPHCTSFEDMSLEEIIDEAVKPYGRSIETRIEPQQTERIPYVVQYNETTYQFIARLAQRYGEYLFFEDGQMYFGANPSGESITLHPDTDILGFRYELNMEHTEFTHAQHDYIKYEDTVENGYDNATDNLHSLTDVAFDKSHELYQKQTLQNLHSSTQEYSSFSQVENSTTVEGLGAKARMMMCHLLTNRADIRMGDRLTIQEYEDLSDLTLHDHEELLVVAVSYHATLEGHFENEVTAIPADAPYAPYGRVDLYPMCESQRAVVVDNNDPEQLGRIRVQFLWQANAPDNKRDRYTPWLRITQPHGGDDKGFYFIPEIGEEVMVAFENGNAEKPYVVGTLYHGQQHPGNPWPDGNNNVKAIRTRNGHTVEIHDEGQGGYIRIYDYQKENYILTYSTDEKLIKLESTGNIELYAKNDIIMHAGNDISMTADHNMDILVRQNREATIHGNDKESVTKEQKIVIGEKQELEVGTSQFITITQNQETQIGGNKYTDVKEDFRITGNNYSSIINENIYVSSKKHEQLSTEKMIFDGGKETNIKANQVKIN
ncbi:MAG: type VI secretion system tip protein VgrG [Bacteroidales bacterium]|nr:type VI secretion system tip protein VgrG [Bacteroidales bacterium]